MITEDEQYKLGIDDDLFSCLLCNPQSFELSDIERVLAVWEGSNDLDDWRWVIRLKRPAAKDGKRFIFLQGGCDYTGWDCQSWATCAYAKTSRKAAKMSYANLGDVPITGNQPFDSGLGHMLQMLSGSYMDNAEEVMNELLRQLKEGKKITWSESARGGLGFGVLPKI